MVVDERLFSDTRADKGGSDHSAKLGVMLAYVFSKEYGKPAYTVDPTNVDEYIDEALDTLREIIANQGQPVKELSV